MLKYYWIILVLYVFIKLTRERTLSSYNTKWLILYAVYVAWMQAEWGFEYGSAHFEIEEFIWLLFLIPLFSYILFSIFYKKIEHWKVISWFNKWIDLAFNRIKELC